MFPNPMTLALWPARAGIAVGRLAVDGAVAGVRLAWRLVGDGDGGTPPTPAPISVKPRMRTRPPIRDRARRPSPAAPADVPPPSPADSPADVAPPRAGPSVGVPTRTPVTPVAETADPGAERGAGAQLHVDEPWEGYGALTAADVRRRLAREAGRETLAAVRLYEATHRRRRTVLELADRRLAELAGRRG